MTALDAGRPCVAHVTLYATSGGRLPERLLADIPHFTGLMAALRALEVEVCSVHAAEQDCMIERPEGVYHFVADVTTWRTRRVALPFRLAEHVASLDPDVIHLHGIGLPRHVGVLRESNPHTPILVQDHANRLPRWWGRRSFARAFKAVNGFAFTSREQAEPFQRLPGWPREAPVFPVIESSTSFQPGDQAEARKRTGVHGNPAVIWIGRLDPNKDPLTVLDGLSRAADALPDLQVWCCHTTGHLQRRAQEFVSRRAALNNRVHWLGVVPHGQIEWLLRAADVFVAGSHREGSGYALIEALACGTPPVVTSIPSFRTLTGNGTIGALFSPGDPASFARAFDRVWAAGPTGLRPAVREYFETFLSYPAVARSLMSAYRALRDTAR